VTSLNRQHQGISKNKSKFLLRKPRKPRPAAVPAPADEALPPTREAPGPGTLDSRQPVLPHPADVQLDLCPAGSQRIDTASGTPSRRRSDPVSLWDRPVNRATYAGAASRSRSVPAADSSAGNNCEKLVIPPTIHPATGYRQCPTPPRRLPPDSETPSGMSAHP